jgi:lysophospholipase L1-like esterase
VPDETTPRTEPIKLRHKMLLVVCSALVSLTICEILVRVFAMVPELHRIRIGAENSAFKLSDNPVLGYELRENAEYTDGEFSERSRTNSHGQWDVERTFEKQSGTTRIIVLGDSVVLGGDVYDFHDNMTLQLEKRLSGRKVEVLNFGVTGYSTRAEIELLETKGLRYDPDLVLLLFVQNDYMNFNNDITRAHFKRPEIVNFLFTHMSLFRLASLNLNLFGFRDQQDIVGKHVRSIGSDNVANGISHLNQLAVEHEFQVMILLWPDFTDDGIFDVETHPIHKEASMDGTLFIERLAQEYGIPTVRLSEYFRRDFDMVMERSKDSTLTPKARYTVDGMHANLSGCHVAAEAMEHVLETRTVILKQSK